MSISNIMANENLVLEALFTIHHKFNCGSHWTTLHETSSLELEEIHLKIISLSMRLIHSPGVITLICQFLLQTAQVKVTLSLGLIN
jgi:hypothetical protein